MFIDLLTTKSNTHYLYTVAFVHSNGHTSCGYFILHFPIHLFVTDICSLYRSHFRYVNITTLCYIKMGKCIINYRYRTKLFVITWAHLSCNLWDLITDLGKKRQILIMSIYFLINVFFCLNAEVQCWLCTDSWYHVKTCSQNYWKASLFMLHAVFPNVGFILNWYNVGEFTIFFCLIQCPASKRMQECIVEFCKVSNVLH